MLEKSGWALPDGSEIVYVFGFFFEIFAADVSTDHGKLKIFIMCI